jgi:DNA repair exonuclease SbcCD nuclease subunit
MKVIHLSDTHLGFAELGRIEASTGLNQREKDVYDAFDAIIAQILDRKPDLVIHAGDLFHTVRPSNRAIVKALVGFKQLIDAGIPTVVVSGNHSTPRLDASGSIFEALELVGVKTAHRSEAVVFRIGEAAVHCIPHLSTEEKLRMVLKDIQPDSSTRFNILVIHGGVRNSGDKYSLGEFNEIVVGKEVLASLSRFDYIALGHYHRHLKVAANTYYCGSTERFHTKEAGYDKGYLEVELDSHRVTFHPMPCRDIVQLAPIDCMGLHPPQIMDAISTALSSSGPLDGKIVHIMLEKITPENWVELDQRRIRGMAASALHISVDRCLVQPTGKRTHSTAIGALPAEFAAFLRGADLGGLKQAKLRSLGEEYLSTAVEVTEE